MVSYIRGMIPWNRKKKVTIDAEGLYCTVLQKNMVNFRLNTGEPLNIKSVLPGPLFTKNTLSYQYGDSHYKPSDRLRFIMGIPIPVRWRLLSE